MPQSADKYSEGFVPTFHPEELSRPKRWHKPRRVFVCSMADLFGDWFDCGVIDAVIQVARDCPQHTFQFLTKWHERLITQDWPSNAWAGCTVTDQSSMTNALQVLHYVDAPVRFLSVEPMQGPITLGVYSQPFVADWIIIGRLTGPARLKSPFDPQWVHKLTAQAQERGVPVFHKGNLGELATLQEFPG
jgi:protein gp37